MAETMVYEDDMAAVFVEGSGITELNTTHRCDSCGSQAYLLYEKPDIRGEIFLCAHCEKKHGIALAEQGFLTLVDDRDKLTHRTSEVHA